MRKTVFFMMAFFGSLAGNIVRVGTAAKAYIDISSVLFLALFTAGFMIGRAIAAIFAGRIFDKNPIHAQNIMVASFILLGIISTAYLFVPVLWYLFIRFVAGILSGLSWPVVQSILLTSSSYSEKSRNMSIYFICGSLGMSTAFLIFIYLDIIVIILIGVILYIATAGLGLYIHPIEERTYRKQQRDIQVVPMREGASLKYIILASQLGLVAAVLSTDTITGILLDRGFSRTELGLVLSVSSYIGIPIGMVGSYASASVADKYGESWMMISLLLLMFGSMVGLIISTDIIIIIVSMVLLRIYVYCYRPILIALAKSSDTTGSNVGIINASHNASTVILSPVIGLLIEGEEIALLIVLVAIMVISAIAIAHRSGS